MLTLFLSRLTHRRHGFAIALLLAFHIILGHFHAHTKALSQTPADLPKIKLPWGTWQAASYDSVNKIYVFKNIRYGKPPIGELRFAKSEFPEAVADPSVLQDNSAGRNCIAVQTSDLKKQCAVAGLGDGSPYVDDENATAGQSEDCLFLDMYIPASAFEGSTASLPVVAWIYGGAFIFGSKDEPQLKGLLYNGSGLLKAAKAARSDMIFVVGNYRLAAYGWLAGSYMEKHGYPNAGLSDQRLMLEFIQQYISLVGGDNTKVSAWGESAGGGSIIHHLIAQGGTRDPLFTKAIVQSPGFQWQWDRRKALNDIYNSFATFAGCENNDIACLRNLPANSKHLRDASRKVISASICDGRIMFGPAVDGNLIQNIPLVELYKGHFWKKMESIIVSRTIHEADNFVPNITSADALLNFLQQVFPGSQVPKAILESPIYAPKPEPVDNNEPQINIQLQRLIDIARDAFFISSIRGLFEAYHTSAKVYAMRYAWPVELYSRHAWDLLPTFYDPNVDPQPLISSLGKGISSFFTSETMPLFNFAYAFIGKFATQYQRYFVSHAITGDPNKLQDPMAVTTWNPASHDPATGNLRGVIRADMKFPESGGIIPVPDFSEVSDDVMSLQRWEFWKGVAESLVAQNGERHDEL